MTLEPRTRGPAPHIEIVTPEQLTLDEILEAQKRAFVAEGIPTLEVRRDRLARLGALLGDNASAIADALAEDFGSRPRALSLVGDVQACLIDIAEQRRHIGKWMAESRPSRLLDMAGIRARVRHDPLGVVGVIGPWNFPLQLAFTPAAAALAAGNRVMVRPSSVTEHTTGLLAAAAPDYFDVSEFALITSTHGGGSDFSKLKFDAMFFTGSPEVGASVATDAAKNLVPVTLELGGKNPVVVDADADIDRAAKLIGAARVTNSGQVCLCPDYVFVPEQHVERFVAQLLETWKSAFPSILKNPDYTSIINDSNYNRINGLVAEAVSLGATAYSATPLGETLPDAGTRKIAPTVLTGVRPGSKIEETEVFGPVLTVYPYADIQQPIDFISAHDHPLTLYWHGPRNKRFDAVVEGTRSGSVQANDFLINMLPAMPFGGVGKSGMGNYHGKYGFETFTHSRAVAFSWSPVKFTSTIAPPYGPLGNRMQEMATSGLARAYRGVRDAKKQGGHSRKILATPPAGSGLRAVEGSGNPQLVAVIEMLLRRQERQLDALERYGDLTFYNDFGRPMVSVMTPEGAELVGMNKFRNYAAGPGWDPLIGVSFKRGLLLMDFEEHRMHRLIFQQAFTSQQLKGYLDGINDVIIDHVAKFPIGEVELVEMVRAIAFDIAAKVFLGLELPEPEKHELHRAFEDALTGLSAIVRKPIPGGAWMKAINGRAKLEEFFNKYLPLKRAEPGADLFSSLCTASDEDGHSFSDEEIVDHMIFLLFAAHDTTTAAMTTVGFYLAKYPEWQERVRKQSLRLGLAVQYNELGEMSDFELVFKECLRLNPPVPAMVREAVEDTELLGYYIPKGTLVSVQPFAVHHNPRVWRDPQTFDPERFAADRQEERVHKMAWMPFGVGVHKCIGLHFAQLEAKAFFHALLRQYDLSVPADTPWVPDYKTLGLPRGGGRVQVRAR
ncbi:aldehyde dehydrogenase family protein [Nocardia sp. NPDC057272]|uniref:aldehyde dehydrogenase family protein n=1 Tax=Nocardia sp. NPDC057272 TaxID=3346079 RepID=UPI0036374C3A